MGYAICSQAAAGYGSAVLMPAEDEQTHSIVHVMPPHVFMERGLKLGSRGPVSTLIACF